MKQLAEHIKPYPLFFKSLSNAREKIYTDDDYLKEWYENYSRNHLRRLSFDLFYLSEEFPNPQGIKVLELGSTPPLLTLAIKERGFDITGLDIAPERFSRCIQENSLTIQKGKIGGGELNFPENTFDAIIMNEVFEHLNGNLIAIMKDLFRILKPGGKIFISTPNLKSMVGIRNFLFKGKAYSCCGEIYDEYDKIDKYGHMGHVREYTPTELRLFLNKIGFTINKLIYRGKYPAKYRIIEKTFPSLKPFFSIIAQKPMK